MQFFYFAIFYEALILYFLIFATGAAFFVDKRTIMDPFLAIHIANTSDNIISVIWDQTTSYEGTLSFRGRVMKCSLGKNGVAYNDTKVEGDGKSPSGTFPLRKAFYRADKINIPDFLQSPDLVYDVTHPNYCWCDDPKSNLYNQFVKCPLPEYSHEQLWLTDSNVYDLLSVIGYNDEPGSIVPGKGSAIFFHVASDSYGPTAGCISISLEDLIWVLNRVIGSSDDMTTTYINIQ